MNDSFLALKVDRAKVLRLCKAIILAVVLCKAIILAVVYVLIIGGNAYAQSPQQQPYKDTKSLIQSGKAHPPIMVSFVISTEDYPNAAYRKQLEGKSVLRLFVNKQGRVERCTVAHPKNILNARACVLAMTRAIFLPAQNNAGNPVSAVVTRNIMWKLPHDSEDRQITKEPELSLDPVLVKACEAGDDKTCTQLIVENLGKTHVLSAQNKKHLIMACDNGSMTSCLSLGLFNLELEKTDTEKAYAFKLFSKACDAQSPFGCLILAAGSDPDQKMEIDFAHAGVVKDKARAMALYRKAFALFTKECENDAALQCGFLGLLYDPENPLRGSGAFVTDNARAKMFYDKGIALGTKGCDSGNILFCEILADLYKEGRIVTPDPVREASFRLKSQQIRLSPAASAH